MKGGVPLLLQLLLQLLEPSLAFPEELARVVLMHELVDVPHHALHPSLSLPPLPLLQVALEV
jgi:hypothetical protein